MGGVSWRKAQVGCRFGRPEYIPQVGGAWQNRNIRQLLILGGAHAPKDYRLHAYKPHGPLLEERLSLILERATSFFWVAFRKFNFSHHNRRVCI